MAACPLAEGPCNEAVQSRRWLSTSACRREILAKSLHFRPLYVLFSGENMFRWGWRNQPPEIIPP
jgi:hypothetical protein